MPTHQQDSYFDLEVPLLWTIWSGSYPSDRLTKGAKAHPTRESVDYALDLFSSNLTDRIERARAIVNTIIRLQEQDETQATYGQWPKYLEEPLRLIEKPDPLWAEVIAYRLCKILCRHKHLLLPEMVEPLSKSISHAAKSIHKRAENGGDERFSLISAIVLLTGAELLSNPSALDYGRERLRQIVQQAQRSGEFGGYNSPALTLLALEEADFLLSVVNDDVSRQYARQISYIAWRSIAEHHHPATRQWAGPHGWTDQDLFDRAHIEGLASRSSGCPKDLRSRLEALPTAEVTVRHLHIHPANQDGNLTATTWLTDDVCLGTVDEEILWHRKRPLIGYWQGGGKNETAVLRARFLHDGRDFASGVIRSAQSKGRVLSSFTVERNGGDLHPFRDRPANGAFRGSDFRVRYQLTASDATIEDLGDGRYAMSSGEYSAIVHTLPGYFHKTEIRWTFGREGTTVYVDGICYTGGSKIVRTGNIRTILLASGLEIVGKNEPISPLPELTRAPEQRFLLSWPDLELAFSSRPRA